MRSLNLIGLTVGNREPGLERSFPLVCYEKSGLFAELHFERCCMTDRGKLDRLAQTDCLYAFAYAADVFMYTAPCVSYFWHCCYHG